MRSLQQLPVETAGPRRPRHWGRALGVAALVLAGHAWLLQGWPGAPTARAPAPGSAPVLQTRQIMALPVAPIEAVAPVRPETAAATHLARATAAGTTPAPVPAAPIAPTPAPARPAGTTPERPPIRLAAATVEADLSVPALADAVAAPPAQPLAPDRLAPAAPSESTTLAVQVLTMAAAASPATTAAAEEDTAVPVYATRLPPPARLQYELRRGAVTGRGRLVWQPGDSQYELSLEGRGLGMLLIEQVSRGGFDAAGIAPLRFVDRRRGRDAQAANFQRDRGLVSYSGPDVQTPLQPGTQDRVSWMIQLAAIVAADPARHQAGRTVTLFVVGARGDASVWTFAVLAREPLALPAGPVAGALHLRREPRHPYDTRVDVWLDPARHHLPVKVRLEVVKTNDSTEFSLQSLEMP